MLVLIVLRLQEISIYILPKTFPQRYLDVIPSLSGYAYTCTYDQDWNYIVTQYPYSQDNRICMTSKQRFLVGSTEAEFIGELFLNDIWDAYIHELANPIVGPIDNIYYISDTMNALRRDSQC